VHADRIPQGKEKRAFFIRSINSTRKSLTGLLYSAGITRSRKTQSGVAFEITYLPDTEMGDKEDDCRAVEEALLDLLEIVPTSDGALIRGQDIRGAISDGVLVVTVRFEFNTLWVPDETMINKLTIGGIKNVS
jgi:hypothetical protein